MTFNNILNCIFLSKSKEFGWSPITANEALDLWQAFVDQCKDGYGWTIFEYRDEIRIRTLIEQCLSSEEFKQTASYKDFLDNVSTIDNKFLQYTLPKDYFKGDYWWERKLPQSGIGDFISTLREAYGIHDVEEIPSKW